MTSLNIILKSCGLPNFARHLLFNQSTTNCISSKCISFIHIKPKCTKPSVVLSNRYLCGSNNMRYNSTSSAPKDHIVQDEFRLIYEGPLSRKIRLIKWFSLSTSFVAVFAAPAFILQGKESVPFVGKMILASTVVTMGVTTTILLHWLTKVYVHKMYFHPHSRMFAAETLNFFGRTRTKRFSVDDISIPEIENAFSTFEANGQRYFIHTDLKEAEQIMKYVKEYNYENL